jgi:hypothetical protein
LGGAGGASEGVQPPKKTVWPAWARRRPIARPMLPVPMMDILWEVMMAVELVGTRW